ncbi:hypothetical protein BDF19DRAFT_421020 [Syncephalis fuscata]|nr:hypothetical protein BDF19DRAFT_421020 [Syncephalis fuscata]
MSRSILHPAEKFQQDDLEKSSTVSSNDLEEKDSPFDIVRATFFWFRETPLTASVLVAQLLSYPLGVFMARTLPNRIVG